MRIDDLEKLTTVLTRSIVEDWLWEACYAGLDESLEGCFAIGDWWCEIHYNDQGAYPVVKHLVMTLDLNSQLKIADEAGCSLEELLAGFRAKEVLDE